MSKWLNGFAVFDTQSLENPFVKDSGNEISVEDVAFSADEKLLATMDRNGLTTLWDVKQRKTIGGCKVPAPALMCRRSLQWAGSSAWFIAMGKPLYIVVLYGGEAPVYGTSLCEAGDVLIQLAGAQALRNTGGTKLGAPRRGWIAVTTACLRPREERRGSAKRRAEKHMPDYFRIASRAKPAARDRGFESISLQQPVCLSGEP